MTQKKVQDVDALIASDDVEAIMAKYIQLSVLVKKLRDRLMREPGMSEIVSGLLPQQTPAIPVVGSGPWNSVPSAQASLIPMPGMQPQYQVPQEGVVDMTGTSQLGEFPMDEYIAGGMVSQQNVLNMLGVEAT